MKLYICPSKQVTLSQGEFLIAKSRLTNNASFSEGFTRFTYQLVASNICSWNIANEKYT
jgi:hypothetical protein